MKVLCGAVLVFVLAGCQATLRIGVDTRANGSGTVTVTVLLDHDAAVTIPDLAQELRTSDLAKDGWKVVGPLPAQSQGVQVVVSKPFRNPAEAITVLNELSGGAPGNGAGPFRGFRLVQRHGLLSSTTTFEGLVDLTCGLRCFGDSQLQTQLGASNLGVDPAALQQQAGIILDRIFKFEVGVRLPGTLQSSNSPAPAGNGAEWQPKLGDKVQLTATARAWNTARVVLLGVGVLALLALLALALVRVLTRRRRPASLSFRR